MKNISARCSKSGSTYPIPTTSRACALPPRRELLEKTNMRMYEVCDAVGYNSVEHFLRTFKRATGQTPLQYRKENVKKHQ